MNIIGETSGNKAIESRYIQRVLNQEAANIFTSQDRVLSRFDTSQAALIKSKRSYKVNGSSLEVTHAMVQRFIDMRNIRGAKRKPIPNHNKVIYTHFNYIINKLAFGLTQDVKNLIAKEYQIEN